MCVTEVILPEFDRAMQTEQNNPHHCYSVGEHTLVSMQKIRADKVLRLTMLFHDLGKARLRGWSFEGEHPSRAISILARCGFELTEEEAFAIRYHHRKSVDVITHPYRRALTKADMESTAAWKRKYGKPSKGDVFCGLVSKLL
jgi:tRNA nucleotidyltransferase (CCA-adding enzyme)